MSTLLEWMKVVYEKAKGGNLQWKPLYPNNMPCNGIAGSYTDMFIKEGKRYSYIKFTIQYMHRCDEDGISHPEEGIRYYVLHQLEIRDLEETFSIPVPSDDYKMTEETDADIVNSFGRFRYVFDDEGTARKVACSELLHIIYPFTHVLSEEECAEWDIFQKHQLENK